MSHITDYIRGYLILEISGFSIERFLNMAAAKDAGIRDFSEDENGVMTFKTPIGSFRTLLRLGRKTKSRIRIKKRVGLPFLLYKYRNRKVFVTGIAVFVAFVWFLSTFIWLVEVEGANVAHLSEIITFLETKGVKAGRTKAGIDERRIEDEALLMFPYISWINVDIKGTRADVKLTEVKEKPEVRQSNTPSDIVALKDGVITKMATTSGTPLHLPGDVVKAGETLVTGRITIGDEETGIGYRWVRAESAIYAKTYHTVTVDVPISVTTTIHTGNIFKEFTLLFLDKSFRVPTLKEPDYVSFDLRNTKKAVKFGDDYPLPFALSVTEYIETKPYRYMMTEEQAERVATETAINAIMAECADDASIIATDITFEHKDGNVRAVANVTVNERIDDEAAVVK